MCTKCLFILILCKKTTKFYIPVSEHFSFARECPPNLLPDNSLLISLLQAASNVVFREFGCMSNWPKLQSTCMASLWASSLLMSILWTVPQGGGMGRHKHWTTNTNAFYWWQFECTEIPWQVPEAHLLCHLSANIMFQQRRRRGCAQDCSGGVACLRLYCTKWVNCWPQEARDPPAAEGMKTQALLIAYRRE
jgi:hypothetical protein